MKKYKILIPLLFAITIIITICIFTIPASAIDDVPITTNLTNCTANNNNPTTINADGGTATLNFTASGNTVTQTKYKFREEDITVTGAEIDNITLHNEDKNIQITIKNANQNVTITVTATKNSKVYASKIINATADTNNPTSFFEDESITLKYYAEDGYYFYDSYGTNTYNNNAITKSISQDRKTITFYINQNKEYETNTIFFATVDAVGLKPLPANNKYTITYILNNTELKTGSTIHTETEPLTSKTIYIQAKEGQTLPSEIYVTGADLEYYNSNTGYIYIYNVTGPVVISDAPINQYNITYNFTNIETATGRTNPTTINANDENPISIFIQATSGYTIPNNIEITGAQMSYYNPAEGLLAIKNATGNVTITITGVKATNNYTVTYNLTNATALSGWTNATTIETEGIITIKFKAVSGCILTDANITITNAQIETSTITPDKTEAVIEIRDPAGNVTVTVIGTQPESTEYSISYEFTNVDHNTGWEVPRVIEGYSTTEVTIYISAASGYVLPDQIIVANADLKAYNKNTGTIKINNAIGDVVITVIGIQQGANTTQISGIWMIYSAQTGPSSSITQSVNFQTNNTSYTSMTITPTRWIYGTNTTAIVFADMEFIRAAYQIVDFGTIDQTVTTEFYNYLNTSADQLSDEAYNTWKNGYKAGYEDGKYDGIDIGTNESLGSYEMGIFYNAQITVTIRVKDGHDEYTVPANFSFGKNYIYFNAEQISTIGQALSNEWGGEANSDNIEDIYITINLAEQIHFNTTDIIFIGNDINVPSLRFVDMTQNRWISATYTYNEKSNGFIYAIPKSNTVITESVYTKIMEFHLPVSGSFEYMMTNFNIMNANGAYNKGFDDGYSKGNADSNQAYQNGYLKGKQDAININQTGGFSNLFTSVIEAPINAFQSMFEFEILGMNMKVLIQSLLTLAVVLIILKFTLFK